MKEIKLNEGMIAIIDDADFDFISSWKWRVFKAPRTNYARRTEGKKAIFMHRVIMGLTERNLLVDHKDFNGLNNQRENLRIVTSSQNCKYKRAKAGSSSKYKGVYFVKTRRKWRANISNGKNIFLGEFNTEEEAALAYNEAAKKYHGEFANLNIIEKKTA